MAKASSGQTLAGDDNNKHVDSAEASGWIWDINENDVLNGRGVSCAQHKGNERFRVLIQSRYDPDYCSKYTLHEKKRLANEIVQIVHGCNPPGRFLKRPATGKAKAKKAFAWNGPWEEMTMDEAVKKARQALRDCNRPDREGYALSVGEERARSYLSEQPESTFLSEQKIKERKIKQEKEATVEKERGPPPKKKSDSASDGEDSRNNKARPATKHNKSTPTSDNASPLSGAVPPVSPEDSSTKALPAAGKEELDGPKKKHDSAKGLAAIAAAPPETKKKRGRPPKKNGPASVKKPRLNAPAAKEKDKEPAMVEAYPDEKKDQQQHPKKKDHQAQEPDKNRDSPQSAEWLRYWEQHFSLRAEVDCEIRRLESKVALASRSDNVVMVREAVDIQKYHLPLLKRLCQMKDKFPSLADMEEELWSVQAELDATRGNVHKIEERYTLLERRDYLNRCWEEESRARHRLGLDTPPEGCWSSLVVQTQPDGHQQTPSKKILF